MTITAQAGALRIEVRGRLAEDARELLERFREERVGSRLRDRDAALWGDEARAEAEGRLGWIGAEGRIAEATAATVHARARLAGFDRAVLVGMGGSSLAAEVVCQEFSLPLTVLDTTDPAPVGRVLRGPLDRTLVVASSKSGETLESAAVLRVLLAAFAEAGLDPAGHLVAVTDPGSLLARTAGELGAAALLGDPTVGGRFSALTPFGLAPAALLGADTVLLAPAARAVAEALGTEDDPGLLLGCALGAAAAKTRGTLLIEFLPSMPPSFGDWLEQLIAESSGKDGRGILPLALRPRAAGGRPADAVLARISADASAPEPDPGEQPEIAVRGPLGAQFLVWEYATAIACRALGVNPFDQPNVQEAKDRAQLILEHPGQPADAAALDAHRFVDGGVEVGLDAAATAGVGRVTSLAELFAALPELIDPDGYLSILGYLDRSADAAAEGLRDALAARTVRPVAFGWGPRYLHSVGQYHKGGPARGAFLIITGPTELDWTIPGGDRTLGGIIAAQAEGDLRSLRMRGRPVVRLRLADRSAGIKALLSAAVG
jgi:glucose-6-phosphate isomerase